MYMLFLYNFFSIMLFIVNATAFLLLHKIVKFPLYLWLCLLFISYVFYHLLLYMVDCVDGFAFYYGQSIVHHPILRTLISIFMYISYGYISAYYLKSKFLLTDKIVFIFFAFLLFILPLLPLSKLNFFAYFTCNQMMFYYYIARIYRGLNNDLFGNTQIRRIKQFLGIVFTLNTLIIAEDFIVIFKYDVIEGFNLHINQRNYTDDTLRLYIAFIALIYVWKIFAQSGYLNNEFKFISDDEMKEQKFLTNLEKFSKQHHLTQREKEIMKHMLCEQSNQEIADLLFITLGTIKTHIHNIYKKTNTSKRSQIIKLVRNL